MWGSKTYQQYIQFGKCSQTRHLPTCHKFMVAMKEKKLSAYLESELKHCEALALRSNPFWVQGVIKLAWIVL